jgi:hypothetical protein
MAFAHRIGRISTAPLARRRAVKTGTLSVSHPLSPFRQTHDPTLSFVAEGGWPRGALPALSKGSNVFLKCEAFTMKKIARRAHPTGTPIGVKHCQHDRP